MSERITRRIDDGCIELFPNSALSMKIYRNETDVVYHISNNMWVLANKLCSYENLENNLKAKGIALDADSITSHIVSTADDLSPELLEAVYRKRELEYRSEDARRQIDEQVHEDIETKGILREAADVLAERFIDKYDCNISENQLWSNIISDFIKTAIKQ